MDSDGLPYNLSLISHCINLMTHLVPADFEGSTAGTAIQSQSDVMDNDELPHNLFLISQCSVLAAADSEGDAAGRAGRAEDQEGHG